MLGFILFLIGLVIILLLVKWIVELVVDPPNREKATKIAVLLVVLLAVLWLAGFGGWPHVYGWHP